MLFLKTFRKQNRFLEIKNIITEMTTSIEGQIINLRFSLRKESKTTKSGGNLGIKRPTKKKKNMILTCDMCYEVSTEHSESVQWEVECVGCRGRVGKSL